MRKAKQPTVYPPGASGVMSVREAKTHFSALVARAAAGEEIVIAWHGRPRARLTSVRPPGAALRVDRAWLETMKVRGRGERAEELVRADRNARD